MQPVCILLLKEPTAGPRERLLEVFKNIGWGLLGIVIVVAMAFVAAILMNGIAWVSGHVLVYLITLNNIVTVLCIVLMLPLAPFKRTRIVPSCGLYVASFVFGVCVWVYGFMVTYAIWGGVGVFFGLILGIVGIVPLGIIAALWHSDWATAAVLIYGVGLTYGARLIALWLWAKVQDDADRLEYVQRASAEAACAKSIRAKDHEPEPRKWWQPSKSTMIPAWVLGLIFVGSLAGILADTQRAPVPPGTPVESPLDKAAAAYDAGDYAASLRLIRPLADSGNAIAQNRLGAMYSNGLCVPLDYAEAAKWLRLAAEQGYSGGQNNLGLMYWNGLGAPRNYAEAVKWFRLAAAQGYAEAQFNLGSMYSNGPLPQNYTEAVKWYQLAADQSHPEAQYFLGIMYANGQGVPQNHVSADMWFILSAAQGVTHENVVNIRDLVEHEMTPAQLTEARKRAKEWNSRPTSR
jgi:hypothetical protein